MPGSCLRRIIMPILCILWISLIFLMSSDADSYNKTLTFSEGVSNQIQSMEPEAEIDANKEDNPEADLINLILRKSGHFLEYLVLSLLLLKTGEVYGMKMKKTLGPVLLLCLLIAGLDEFYQSFIPGRNAAVLDSLIDLSGARVGVGVFGLFIRTRHIEEEVV